MTNQPYLTATRKIVYARYVSSYHHEEPAAVENLQNLLEKGEVEIVSSGVLAAPFAVQANERINALLKAGNCYYFAWVERREE